MASVIKRPHTRADGSNGDKWTVRYFDEKGVRRSKGCDSKKAADAFKRQVEREVEDGTHTADKASATIAKVCDEFMVHQDTRLAERRLGEARHTLLGSVLKNHIRPNIGRLLIAKLTFSDVERLRAAISSTGAAPITVSQYLFIFKQVEDFARKRGLTKLNVTADVCREHSGVKKDRVRTPSIDEVKAILAAVETRGRMREARAHSILRCAVHAAAFCGLRFGEVMALGLDAIDDENGVLWVTKNLTRYDELKGPKTRAGARQVPMPPHIATMLREHARRHPTAESRGLIFRTRTGTQIQSAAFHRDSWRPLLAAAEVAQDGIQRLHFHALRHFAASSYVSHGVPLNDIPSLIGHASFDTTMQIYVHAITGGNRRRTAVDAMAASLYLPSPDATMTHAA